MSLSGVPKFSDLTAVALGWVVIAVGTLLLAALELLSVGSVIAVAAGAALLTFLALGAVRRRRISRLNGAAASIREDERIDLSHAIACEVDPSYRSVAETLDALTYALNTIMLDITTASRKFSLFSSDIFFSGRHLSELSDAQAQVMTTVLDHAEGFQRDMNGLVESIAACLREMEQTSARYAELRRQSVLAGDRIEPLSAATAEAESLAAAGRDHMRRSLASTAELSPAISHLNGRIDEMLERTSRIESLLSALQDIAETTHVLATNASIEAARAGSAGRGFAVIAGEIRTLSGDSRRVIEEVADFLNGVVADIRESSTVSRRSAAEVQQLEEISAETGSSLEAIIARITDIAGNMSEFRGLFDRQTDEIGTALGESERIHHLVEEIGGDIRRHADGYDEIRRRLGEAADGARGAAHSARVLSQLGTYLRTGGQEMSHVVESFTVSEERFLGGLTRKEPRTTLLYNLEVYRGEVLLGHLGDISPSGLMIYTADPLTLGEEIDATIHLPLTLGEQRDVPIRFVPRRTEKQSWFCKTGCSIDAGSSRRQQADIEMIITNYTITQGMDSMEILGVGSSGSGPAGADGRAGAASAGAGSTSGPAALEELEDVADLEDVEELEELE
jgi:methyl-accepting chemotaxis protein